MPRPKNRTVGPGNRPPPRTEQPDRALLDLLDDDDDLVHLTLTDQGYVETPAPAATARRSKRKR